jgi:hypothetical protein
MACTRVPTGSVNHCPEARPTTNRRADAWSNVELASSLDFGGSRKLHGTSAYYGRRQRSIGGIFAPIARAANFEAQDQVSAHLIVAAELSAQ